MRYLIVLLFMLISAWTYGHCPNDPDDDHTQHLAKNPHISANEAHAVCRVQASVAPQTDTPAPAPAVSAPAPIVQPIAAETVVETPNTDEQTFARILENAQPAPTQLSVVSEQLPLRITEYMLRDGGSRRLPVWIELWNPNPESVSLKGYTFTWATRKFANVPWVYHVVTIGDFSIPAGSAAILTSKRLTRIWQYGGIADTQVYDLGIKHGRLLKSGWKIEDANGVEIYSVGRAFSKGGPVLEGNWKKRKSHEIYKSGKPPKPYFYGVEDDNGSPGFYYELTPKSPRLIKPKKIGMWARLKRKKS